MKRLPLLFSFLLFLALSATLAYWIVQWTAPVPRAVSAPSKSERTMPPISAAASLFGGRSPSSATIANVQLRGVVHSSSLSDSVAIISIEGKSPRALTVNSEIVPGVIVKKILNKTVVVSEKGAERELSLPAFATQEGNTSAPQASVPPAPNLPPANPSAALSTATSTGASGSSSAQGSSMTSPSPTRSANQSQSGVAPTASEPARPPPSQ
jgi:general secretion pathway protein C